MAKEARTNSRRKAPDPGKKRRPKKKTRKLNRFPKLRFAQPDFRPDTEGTGFLKYLHFTKLQRLQLLRWLSYIAVCVLCLVIQDVIMSRISILDTTFDLPAGIILLITVMEGSEVGSVFVLIASMVYYFSGSAPGPYVVGLLSVLGILATVFRQQVWHRSIGSIVLCSGLAVVVYEISLYAVGLFLGLTRWDRIFAFLLCGLLTAAALIPLYHIIYRVGQIGGNVWKE